MPQRMFASVVAVVALSLSLSGCASRSTTGQPVRLTGAEVGTEYAAASAQAIRAGAYPEALSLAERSLRVAPDNPWAWYDRAVALHGLEQTDAALQAYRDAEARFGGDRWGRSLAMYGRARALRDAGRCKEAEAAYGEFGRFVQSTDPTAASMAASYARDCRPRAPAPESEVATSSVTSAVLARSWTAALELADDAARRSDRPDPWLDYNRAVALAELGRTDEAVRAYGQAERRFGGDRRGRSLAIYGRARALDAVGRCEEAQAAYEQYAALLREDSPADADAALAKASACYAKP